MSFYRHVHVRTWGDEKFQELSPAPPNAQTLWLYLLTGKHTGPVPGLFAVGAGELAENLGWDVEPLRERFAELVDKGMAEADFKARVVWLPNALRHNPPANPNQVKGWATYLDQIPECALKTKAMRAMRDTLAARGESFVKPFAERFGKALVEPYGKQEREREREREEAVGPVKTVESLGNPGRPQKRQEEKAPAPPSEEPESLKNLRKFVGFAEERGAFVAAPPREPGSDDGDEGPA